MTMNNKILNSIHNNWIITKFYYKSGNEHFLDEALQASSHAFMMLAAMAIFQFSGTLSNEIITYIIFGNLLYTLTNPRIDWLIGDIIKDKKLMNYALTPKSMFQHFSCLGLANSWFGFLVSSISIVPLLLLLNNQIEFVGTPLANVFIFLITIVLSFLFRVAFQLLVAFSTFVTKEVGGSVAVSINLELFLAGTLFLISVLADILPEKLNWLEPIIYLQPLAFVIYHPMQIILGNYNTNQSLSVLAGMFVWTVVFWVFTIHVLKWAKAKNKLA